MKIRSRRSREQWQELVRQWEASKATATAWCKQNDIPYESFIIWKNRLKSERAQPTLGDQPFVELTDTPSASSGIELYHRDLKLIIGKQFHPETLLQCLRVLKRLSC